jgi:hypothetical protein
LLVCKLRAVVGVVQQAAAEDLEAAAGNGGAGHEALEVRSLGGCGPGGVKKAHQEERMPEMRGEQGGCAQIRSSIRTNIPLGG